MGLFDKLFGKRAPTAAAHVDRGLFADQSQQKLNTLGTMLPMTMDLIRSPGAATVVFGDVSESEGRLVQGLSDAQYKKLREIQELFRLAMNASGNAEKLKLYLRCAELAPWHAHALKSAGVCYFSSGDKARAIDYLKRAVELAPDDERIRQNYQHVLAS